MAGKGSTRRPYNYQAWSTGYDNIDFSTGRNRDNKDTSKKNMENTQHEDRCTGHKGTDNSR